ncbi:MAG: aminotransferase class I/II-fold pyridoxal phosphate-dependent enzyme [Anaerosomatales bacterium]|nr:aminotransferase class I/II-fold pyridoxal phosphate-dependent enzyme [Anaerosomatales bacterium]MDT8435062.1 aminotransferase class I/II-fold pyridoxal phosphate-dependent enzyme [Anaerosomatales bacterium]
MTRRVSFGSDNHSGVHPRVMEAITRANEGHVHAYGDDPWTAEAIGHLRAVLGDDIDVAFTFNGTGANVVTLATICRPWESVICAETAHINVDECAAPERIAGVKLVPIATPDGKLTPELVRPHLTGFGFQHHAQPRVISVSQASEYGTVYSVAELRDLADLAHAHGMLLHVDGARFANAVVHLGCTPAGMLEDGGVDALSFGGTKNGMLLGEAVVLVHGAPADTLAFVRKQCGQLASKMRFVAAQFSAMLADGLWLETAAHANAMAARIAEGLGTLGVEVTQPVQANEVFALLPADCTQTLAERFGFYTWDTARGEVRLVTSWDTQPEDVDDLITSVREAIS